VLEEYLAGFKGCLIVVSHDRYFMDKVVDHLLVFHGDAKIQDFPGNYSQYREWKAEEDRREAAERRRRQSKLKPRKPRQSIRERVGWRYQRQDGRTWRW